MNERKYYWTNRASQHNIDRLRSLITDLPESKQILLTGNPRYITYVVDQMESKNGHRIYQFLIEYDIYNPSQGIYFGCKSLTKKGHHHHNECEKALCEWIQIREEMTKRLNNVFVDKDFSYRFRETDNASDNTFWPFWISLNEDESPMDVGVRALRIIARVYSDYANGRITNINSPDQSASKLLEVRTAFTNEAFERLMIKVEESVKNVSSSDNGKISGEEGRHLLQTFFTKAEATGLLEKSPNYEKAWRMQENISDVEFKALMKALFAKIGELLVGKGIRVPWGDVTRVMMRNNETAYKEQVKTLNVQMDVEKKYTRIIDDILTK